MYHISGNVQWIGSKFLKKTRLPRYWCIWLCASLDGKDDNTMIIVATAMLGCVRVCVCDLSWFQQPLELGLIFPFNWRETEAWVWNTFPWACLQVTRHPCAFRNSGSLTPKQQQKFGASLETGMWAQKSDRDYQSVCRKNQIMCPSRPLPVKLQTTSKIGDSAFPVVSPFPSQVFLHIQTEHCLAGFRRIERNTDKVFLDAWTLRNKSIIFSDTGEYFSWPVVFGDVGSQIRA